MPGALTHSPADVLSLVLIQLGVCAAPPSADWSVFVNLEPDAPERCVTLYDDEGVIHGRVMVGGEVQEHHAVQVRIRSEVFPTGYAKARAIAVALDAQYQTQVILEGHSYVLHCANRIGDVIPLPKQPPVSSRNLFTLNYLLSLRERGV